MAFEQLWAEAERLQAEVDGMRPEIVRLREENARLRAKLDDWAAQRDYVERAEQAEGQCETVSKECIRLQEKLAEAEAARKEMFEAAEQYRIDWKRAEAEVERLRKVLEGVELSCPCAPRICSTACPNAPSRLLGQPQGAGRSCPPKLKPRQRWATGSRW